MRKFKNSRFFIVFLFFLGLVYFYDTDLYYELKTSMLSNGQIEVDENNNNLEKSDETSEDDVVSLIKTDELMSPLRVYFFDVGQADSTLIQFDDEYMLIDAGNNEDGKGLVNYLKSLGVDKFKYVVGTHAHEDHIGGMDDVIESFEIDKFFMPDVITTTLTFEDVLDSLLEKEMYFDTPKINDTFKLGDAVIEVIYVGDDEKDLNNTSIVIRVIYDNVSFLLTGDAETSAENIILKSGTDISSTVLKAGHHGSSTSSSNNFLKKVNPSFAVISSGKGNSYGHPHDELINRLNKFNIKFYRTDELGTIIASTDGKDISFTNISTNIDG